MGRSHPWGGAAPALGALPAPPAGAAHAAWPGLDGRVSITQNRPTLRDDVYAFSRLGDTAEPLTTTNNLEEQSTWSPGGKLIAYKRSDEVFVRDVTTSAPPTRLTVKGVTGVFNTQPDGKRIAFEIHPPDLGEGGDVFVMDADGTQVQQLTMDPAHDEGPAWSPDGTMLAFTSTREDPLGDTWTMNADGSAQANLTRTPLLEESPDWQPLPFPEGLGAPGHPRVPCGDLSLEPGGVSSIQSVRAPCRQARRVARAWLAGAKTYRYACASAPHSFDQVVVACDHRGDRQAVAFVHRLPVATP